MSKQTAASLFNFEQWSELARNDPASFEQLRSRMLDACITQSSASHRDRLRRLQWRIDRLRDQSSNPLAACVEISDLMWTTFHQLGQAYHNPGHNSEGQVKSAHILPLKPRQD